MTLPVSPPSSLLLSFDEYKKNSAAAVLTRAPWFSNRIHARQYPSSRNELSMICPLPYACFLATSRQIRATATNLPGARRCPSSALNVTFATTRPVRFMVLPWEVAMPRPHLT